MRNVILISSVVLASFISKESSSQDLRNIPQPAHILKGKTSLTRIAFGSCADEEKAQPIWKTIAADNPQLFLFTGDNVYADRNEGKWVNDPSASSIAFAYNALGANKDFTDFYSKVPMMVTWDDHDFGRNDAGRDFPMKQVAKDYMLDFFSFPKNHETRSRDGVYHSRLFGEEGKRVQIIMLDTRWFRSELTKTDERNAPGKERYVPSQDPDQDMLGEVQWKWLELELQKEADVRIVVSATQVLADTHGWEAWRTMPQEREKLYTMLSKAKGGKAVILSGDRHVGGIYRRHDVMDYPIYEVTSSSINLSFNPDENIKTEWDKNQLGLLYGPENYGLMEIDWDKDLLNLQLKGMDGQIVRQVVVPLQEISTEVENPKS